MAKPIAKTPVFEGEDAIAVLKEMQEAPTQEDKEFAKEIRNQRIVLFSTSFRIYFYNPIYVINFFLIFFQIFEFMFFNIETECSCICIYSYKS